MITAKIVREACLYEAGKLVGKPGTMLTEFALSATDEQLLRFAELIGNLDTPQDHWEPTDSADLARANID